MTDTYSSFVNSPIGGKLAGALGLPQPTELRATSPARRSCPDRSSSADTAQRRSP